MNNYFNDKMFNPNYVNPEYYNATMKEMKYSFNQDKKVIDLVRAMHDLCEAVKGRIGHIKRLYLWHVYHKWLKK